MNFYQWASTQPVFIQIPLGLVIFIVAAILLRFLLLAIGWVLVLNDSINLKVLLGKVDLESEIARNGDAEKIKLLRKRVWQNFILCKVIWPIAVIIIIAVIGSLVNAIILAGQH